MMQLSVAYTEDERLITRYRAVITRVPDEFTTWSKEDQEEWIDNALRDGLWVDIAPDTEYVDGEINETRIEEWEPKPAPNDL
ncbi:hypothetical protein SEA_BRUTONGASTER_152 [Gordonia phage BrutonGaster]|uniref:Uncharacterized protein n=1 Tax=Gordonia phage BrutonGaster TaxID=2530116 RepID=A0A482JKX3_9CAUD|nr:hypothetical protein HOV26_gp030 [Gordonia phage BrutonGaster]QBP33366.1 hypothetical protein SEA_BRUTONGASTER_152 [Gordonia phage BrutonGaster]